MRHKSIFFIPNLATEKLSLVPVCPAYQQTEKKFTLVSGFILIICIALGFPSAVEANKKIPKTSTSKRVAKASIKRTRNVMTTQTKGINKLFAKKTKLDSKIAKQEANIAKLKANNKPTASAEAALDKTKNTRTKLSQNIKNQSASVNKTYQEYTAAKKIVSRSRKLELAKEQENTQKKVTNKAKAKFDKINEKLPEAHRLNQNNAQANQANQANQAASGVYAGFLSPKQSKTMTKAEQARQSFNTQIGKLNQAERIKQSREAKYKDSVEAFKAARNAQRGPAFSDPQLATDATVFKRIINTSFQTLN